jgi:nitroimidazol reductase NimA-like FMN-containing flavoprotein (pyridoxamine 5'-phosphate oxidase superfamily)
MAGDDQAKAAVTNDAQLAVMAAQIIDANRYLVLATADQHGVPWVSPLWYAHAGYREFFWVSDPQARHSQNIGIRPGVSIVIFDSSGRPGAASAVYISGTAGMVAGPDLERSIEIYSRRSLEQGLPAWTPSSVQAPARHRLYRAVAAEQSVLQPGGVDVRIPVAVESVATHRSPDH